MPHSALPLSIATPILPKLHLFSVILSNHLAEYGHTLQLTLSLLILAIQSQLPKSSWRFWCHQITCIINSATGIPWMEIPPVFLNDSPKWCPILERKIHMSGVGISINPHLFKIGLAIIKCQFERIQ